MRQWWIAVQLCGIVIFWYPFATPWPVVRKKQSAYCRYRVLCGKGHWQEYLDKKAKV